MTAHGICFDFYYRPKSSQIVQNGSAAAADARLAVCIQLYVDHTVSKKPMNSQIWEYN